MSILYRFLPCALLPLLAVLTGCVLFSSEAWQGPSPLSGRPPPPPEKHEPQGGFTVLVNGPGQPAAARVAADIGAFALRHGFVLQSVRSAPSVDPVTHAALPPAPERYVQGAIVLDVAYRASDQRVTAFLHGSGFKFNHRFADRFFHDFDQEYATRYGGEDPISESDFIDE